MALPKKTNKILNQRLSLMDDAVDFMSVEDTEEQMFKALRIFLIKELDLDKDGNIKRTAKNLRTVQRVRTLRNIILNDTYKAQVSKFINSFNTVRSLSDEYIRQL